MNNVFDFLNLQVDTIRTVITHETTSPATIAAKRHMWDLRKLKYL